MKERIANFKALSEVGREEYINKYLEKRCITKEHKHIISKYRLYWKNGGFVNDIKSRDKFQCRCCGSSSDLQVHHIVSVSQMIWKFNVRVFEELFIHSMFWDDNNVITLCNKCHRKVHENDTHVPQQLYERVKISREVLLQIEGNRETQTQVINEILIDRLDREYQKSMGIWHRIQVWASNLI